MKKYFTLLLLTACQTSCKKDLNRVPSSSITAPQTLQDLRALMDYNKMTENSTPGLGLFGSDDCLLRYPVWQGTAIIVKNAYVWKKDIFGDEKVPSWNDPYAVVYQCNVVLNYLPGMPVPDTAGEVEHNAIEGAALFIRAFEFYSLEETFGQPYRPGSADSDPGIPLHLRPDLHERVGRSTVEKVYAQIIADAKKAATLLPDEVQFSNRNRPCKPAAFALLARAYLTMQEYDSAWKYADSSLYYYDTLMRYDTVNAAAMKPFPATGNDEVLYQSSAVNIAAQYLPTTEVDTALYDSYADDDLRKFVFFQTTPSGTGHYFKGSYSGKLFIFSGLATDEVYLIRAECYARTGYQAKALQDLNALLSRRWKTGTFQPYADTADAQVLPLILNERRKETVFRELRWGDLRRLYQEAHSGPILQRNLNGSVYTLMSGDPRFAYPIPVSEIILGGIQQNPR